MERLKFDPEIFLALPQPPSDFLSIIVTYNKDGYIFLFTLLPLCYYVYTKCIYKGVVRMASTQVVNFRADSISYQKTKEILSDEKITVSDVLNAALRKIANGTVDAKEFVSSDLKDTQYQVAFEDLKKEILAGHQEIAQGKVTSLADVRKEFNLD